MTARITRTVYPISMLLQDRPCLIVGGGKVAARKADGLLDAGAAITVISPNLDDHLALLVQQGKIQHIAREYQKGDVSEYALVFAATGSRYINREVLQACRALRIPCCPVDGNWMDGDFVTPATIRKDQLSVAISTGGQSCRRSRLIKENLSRHLAMVDTADLVVIGTSHHELDLQKRDPLQLQGQKLIEVGSMLMHVWGLHEFMLISTCNRIELLAIKAHGQGTSAVLRKILGFDALSADSFYVKKGAAAFEHTALLAAGLLSQMTGENHIVAQIKDALSVATANQWAGGMLKEWIAAALHISKEIRQAMPQNWLQGEIEDAAIQYLLTRISPLDGQPPTGLAPVEANVVEKGGQPHHPSTLFTTGTSPVGSTTHQPASLDPLSSILVIGTGTVGTGIVQRLSALNIPCSWVYHHNKPEAAPTGTKLHAWCDLPRLLSLSDCVITAVTTAEPILTADMAPQLANRPVLLIDLATPRNIAKTLATDQTQILDLDGLKHWQACASGTWDALLNKSRNIIHDHQTMYNQIMRSFHPPL